LSRVKPLGILTGAGMVAIAIAAAVAFWLTQQNSPDAVGAESLVPSERNPIAVQAGADGIGHCTEDLDAVAGFVTDGRSFTARAFRHAIAPNGHPYNVAIAASDQTGTSEVSLVSVTPSESGCSAAYSTVRNFASSCEAVITSTAVDFPVELGVQGVVTIKANTDETIVLYFLPAGYSSCTLIKQQILL